MATYYILATGNDSTGDGSNGNPWKTISKAHTAASSGDTIIVKSSATAYVFESQGFTKSLTITGESTTATNQTFNGAGLSFTWSCATSSVTLTISNLKFTNTIMTSSQAWLFYFTGNSCTQTYTNCIFDITMNTGTYLFSVNGGTPHTLSFTSCFFTNFGTTGTRVGFWTNITTCVFTMNKCTVYIPNGITNLFTAAAAVTLNIKNTIIYSGGTTTFNSSSATNAVTYSDLYGITGGPTGTGVITSDPLFVDVSTSNYNLRSTSPCIDTGNNP